MALYCVGVLAGGRRKEGLQLSPKPANDNVGQRVVGLRSPFSIHSPAFCVDPSALNLIIPHIFDYSLTYVHSRMRLTEDASSWAGWVLGRQVVLQSRLKGAKTNRELGKWDPSPKKLPSFSPPVHPLSLLGPVNIATRKPDLPRSHSHSRRWFAIHHVGH